MHLAYFRGVQNAAEIRDLMLERLRRWRDTGLGDPDEAAAENVASGHDFSPGSALLEAARGVLTEAQAVHNDEAS